MSTKNKVWEVLTVTGNEISKIHKKNKNKNLNAS